MNILFMTYINRSGSTFLANLLSSSESICVCPEGDWLVSYFLEAPGKVFSFTPVVRRLVIHQIKADEKFRSWNLRGDLLENLSGCKTNFQAFNCILNIYRSIQKPSAEIILFKAERIAALIGKISRSETNDTRIRFLSLVRDPRAVIASQMNTFIPGTRQRMAGNPVNAAMNWNHYLKCITAFGSSAELFMIRYEELIKNPIKTILALEEFMHVNLAGVSPVQGDLLERLPDSHRPIHTRVEKIPCAERISAWQDILSEKDVYRIEKTCRVKMTKMGYQQTVNAIRPVQELYRTASIFIWYIRRGIRVLIYHSVKILRNP